MTSYWKPRWEDNVVFGSYKDLYYRLDLSEKEGGILRIRTKTGPGEQLDLKRSECEDGFVVVGKNSDQLIKYWMNDTECKIALSELFKHHFSKIKIRNDHIECFCKAKNEDILPEGPQLGWCVSLLYLLLSKIPDTQKQHMIKSDFME